MAGKSRYWITIIYPESCNPSWQEILETSGIMALASPIHDKDKNATGEFKKPHRHLLLCWDGPTTKKSASAWVEQIGGVGCFPAVSVRGCARYWCHLDNPDKARYSPTDVIAFGGLDYLELINTVADDIMILRDIFNFCEENKVISYRELMIVCRTYKPEWEKIIITKYRENVFRYLRSFENDLKHPESFSDQDGVETRFKQFFVKKEPE